MQVQFITLTDFKGDPVTVNLAHVRRISPAQVYYREEVEPAVHDDDGYISEYAKLETRTFDGSSLIIGDAECMYVEVREPHDWIVSAIRMFADVHVLNCCQQVEEHV